MNRPAGQSRARNALPSLFAPDRAALIARTLRVADPDEAETFAVDLCEALLDAAEHPPLPARVLAAIDRAGLGGLVPDAWRASHEARFGVGPALAAAAALAERWAEYPPATRRLAATALARWWDDALKRVHADRSDDAFGPSPEAIAGILAAAVEGPNPADPGRCADLLGDAEPVVVEAAAIALGRLAAAALRDHTRDAGSVRPDAGLIDTMTAGLGPAAAAPTEPLGPALERAVRTVDDHRQRGVLTAAVAWLVHGPSDRRAVADWLGPDAGHRPGGREIAAAFRRAPGTAVRAAAWRWLAGAGADAVMLERLGLARDPAEHEALLEASALALRPERRRRAAPLLAASADAALPDRASLDALGERARLGFVRLVDALAPDGPARSSRLASRLTDPSPAVRLAACRAAAHVDLLDWTLDRSPAVARSAALRWTGTMTWGARGPASRRTVEAEAARAAFVGVLARSPHARVRSIATDAAGSIDPWRADSRAGSLGLRALHAADPDATTAELRRRVVSGPSSIRVAAIRLAERAGLAERIAAELTACARLGSADVDGGERIAATAVRALRRVRTDDARRTLTEALDATDARVRANAVESIAASGDAAYPVVAALRSDAGHRVRANAVRAMLAGRGLIESKPSPVYDPAGVESLESMLTDDRAGHRLAAVWLAERTLCGGGAARFGEAFEPLARRVASIARGDADEAVRTRGVRCASRLLAEVRAGAAAGAGAPEGAAA